MLQACTYEMQSAENPIQAVQVITKLQRLGLQQLVPVRRPYKHTALTHIIVAVLVKIFVRRGHHGASLRRGRL